MSGRDLLRRAVMLPTVVVVQTALIVVSPVLLLLAGVVTLVARSSRPLRTVGLVVAFGVIELTTLAQVLARPKDWDRLVLAVFERCYGALSGILDVPLSLEPGSASPQEVADSFGVIALARHCGPGDSLYVAWLLASHYRLSLRIVLTSKLRFEPSVDLAAAHVPLCFVERRPGSARAGVGLLAGTLSTGDALLLFPEGGNFTWNRWRAALRHLVEQHDRAGARRARRQTHTLPPRPGGVVTALAAAPHADVLLVAHSGFRPDGRDRLWWRLPVKRALRVRTVLVPAAAVARDEAGARAFLETAWSLVDTWVEGYVDLAGSLRDGDGGGGGEQTDPQATRT